MTETANEPENAALSRLRSVLVPTDLTPASDRVLGRVGRLPLADDARVTLLHVVPDGLLVRDQRTAVRHVEQALPDEARHLASSLPKTIRVESLVKIGAPAKEIAEGAATMKAELVVMGRGGRRAVRDAFLGSTAERVIRWGRLPVLVVRLPPRAPYRRPMLALDLDDTARDIVSLALRVLPPPRPRLPVLHAFATPYQGLVYPGVDEDEEWRSKLQQETSQALAQVLVAALDALKVPHTDRPLWKLHIRYGSPRVVIEKVAEKAETDLLVLGTHGRSGLAYMFLGTVAGDVLREVTCDVLVVPPTKAS